MKRIIVALDMDNVVEATNFYYQLTKGMDRPFPVFKIGYQLLTNGGWSLVEYLANEGTEVFLDLKLLDIPNTVTEAVKGAARLGASYITVHGYPQTMKAAAEAKKTIASDIKLLAVTVLTSMSKLDLTVAGYGLVTDVETVVRNKAHEAVQCGFEGIIASALEARMLRTMPWMNETLIVTPGVRRSGDNLNDQKRVATPKQAIMQGSDMLVIGRSVLKSKDPVTVLKEISDEIDQAVQERTSGKA